MPAQELVNVDWSKFPEGVLRHVALPEVDLLSTGVHSVTIPASTHVWVEEVGLYLSKLTLDGGSLSSQPTISFGVSGNNAKYLAAQAMSLLNVLYNRERFDTLLADVGETTLTMEITVAGVISGGGAGKLYKARPYWRIALLKD